MITKTYYFPCNQIGRHILNCVIERVGCSIGTIHKVADTIAVSMTVRANDTVTIERILQTYDLL